MFIMLKEEEEEKKEKPSVSIASWRTMMTITDSEHWVKNVERRKKKKKWNLTNRIWDFYVSIEKEEYN